MTLPLPKSMQSGLTCGVLTPTRRGDLQIAWISEEKWLLRGARKRAPGMNAAAGPLERHYIPMRLHECIAVHVDASKLK
ncbi:MAG: hypothetical protein QOI70_1788 [Microbacteriaceae bacterium]|nr:hypothetical protein [Microbacteriaceae bacterium]